MLRKIPMVLVLLMLLLPAIARAADVKLIWDPGTNWESVRIYEKTGTSYVKVGEVAGNLNQITISGVVPGIHTYIARSFVSPWESADSNQASTPAVPAAPSGVKVVVTVTITSP